MQSTQSSELVGRLGTWLLIVLAGIAAIVGGVCLVRSAVPDRPVRKGPFLQMSADDIKKQLDSLSPTMFPDAPEFHKGKDVQWNLTLISAERCSIPGPNQDNLTDVTLESPGSVKVTATVLTDDCPGIRTAPKGSPVQIEGTIRFVSRGGVIQLDRAQVTLGLVSR